MAKTPVGQRAVEARMWLNIFGRSLDFEGITNALGVRPSDCHRAGDLDPSRRPLPRDLWSLGSPLPRTEPLDAHIKWLFRALEPCFPVLRQLTERAEVRSFCGILAEGDRCGFRVSSEALRFFVELTIPMEISLIFTGYSDLGRVSSQTELPEEEPAGTPEPRHYDTESSVIFQILGGNLDLAGISKSLGLEPSATHRAGDVDQAGNPYGSDMWSLKVPSPKSDELDTHLRWLGTVLLPHADFLRSLGLRAELLIRCNFGTESDTGGVGISPEGLKVCTELGIPLEFTTFLI